MYDYFKSIGSIISEEKEFKSLRKIIRETEVIDKFFDIFPELSKMVVPEKVEKSTLFLYIENAALRNEIKFHETDLIKKINEFFKEKRIRYLRLLGT